MPFLLNKNCINKIYNKYKVIHKNNYLYNYIQNVFAMIKYN